MTEINYEARVAKGIALLDQRVSGWADMIDVDVLDINTGHNCVTAQVAKGVHLDIDEYDDHAWRHGMTLLVLSNEAYNRGSYTEHGFNAETHDAPFMPQGYSQDHAYETLTQIWRREITARQTTEEQS